MTKKKTTPKILVADDLQTSSAEDLRRSKLIHSYARTLGRDLNAPVEGVHVEPPVFSVFGTRSQREWLKRVAKKETETSYASQIRMLEGDPAETLLKITRKKPLPFMIIVGTHGHAGLKRMILGSVAEEVIRGAHIPVFVLGPKVMSPPSETIFRFKSILVASDLSKTSIASENFAFSLAKKLGLKTTFFHSVFDTFHPVIQSALATSRGEKELTVLFEESTQAAENLLKKKAKRFHSAGLPCETVLEKSLAPASNLLLEQLDKNSFDLVIMGTYSKKRGVARLLGSSARHVILAAPIPVITVASSLSR